MSGFAGLQLPDAPERGAHGLIGGCGHLEPDIAVFRALETGTCEARQRFSRLERLLDFEMQSIHTSIATHKCLLTTRGIFESSRVRSPGAGLDQAQRCELERLRAELG